MNQVEGNRKASPESRRTPSQAMNPVFKSEAGRMAILTGYESITTRWPVPYSTRYVDTSFGRIHLLEWGNPENPPLVLLHGSSSNAAMWMGDAVAFGRRFHAFAIDMPGECGLSEGPRPAFTGKAHSGWMRETIDALGLSRFHLVGLSLGGWVALQFACRWPEHVERFGLLCPSGIGAQRRDFIAKALPLMLLGPFGMRRLIRKINGGAPIPREAEDYSLLIAKEFKPVTGTVPLLPDEMLKRLTMPVLLMTGQNDILLDSAGSQKRAGLLIPNLKAIHLPDAGHTLVNKAGDLVPFLLGEE